jgi:DNA-binding Lrp family transcriptional regulator
MLQATGITTKTVKRRLDELVEDQIIGFSTIFSPEALRGYLMFYVLLNIENGASSRLLEEIRALSGT